MYGSNGGFFGGFFIILLVFLFLGFILPYLFPVLLVFLIIGLVRFLWTRHLIKKSQQEAEKMFRDVYGDPYRQEQPQHKHDADVFDAEYEERDKEDV